ncbi:MAG: DUF4097 family beta strand repeat-containing protein [Blastocatellia bacterium]
MKILVACLILLAFALTFLDSPKAVKHSMAHDHESTSATNGAEVTDQINKTVTLAPGSNVRITGFNGRVTVETSESNNAEINIQVKASSQEAMDRKPVVIEHTANTLVIKTENDKEGGKGGWDRGHVNHTVNVRLPRSSNLKVSSVNGGVTIGQLAGEVGVSSVNGRVKVELAGTVADLSSINGGVSVTMMKLSAAGLRVSSVNGGVEIGIRGDVNADVDVHGVNGGIDSDLPISAQGEMKRGQLVGKIGSGGAPIKITSVNGGVTLRRN